ncbi:polysaccharide deacetylase family protein [Kineosporia sp. A_224]|uniref:polysaccharide deacetylase family protein n=1 Tax=Kineosporia sp. A_224 TaxID=1962180 RepID=UPI00117B75A7|nr:polysaccharide deacetylase family protein [Kineosporia sp. A_224]
MRRTGTGRRLPLLALAVAATFLGLVTPAAGRAAPTPSAHRPVTEPTAATDPATGPLPAVPASQRRCPAPAVGVVTHTRAGGPPTVALTFDDGPDAGTPAVLDALAAAHVHATFFVVGRQVERHPGLVRRVADEGHLLGDHTWDHAYPQEVDGGWTALYLADQIGRTARAVEAATGRPLCWFRPPGGHHPGTVRPAAHRMRMTVAMWSVDARDWEVQGVDGRRPPGLPDLDAKVRAIVARATDVGGEQHPVVLLHDGGGDRAATAAAVPLVVAWYRDHGFTFVRLDGRR